MTFSVDKANDHVATYSCEINKRYRMGYHMMPPVGWMNDPNGLIYSGGRYHVFYQFYPYATVAGAMHWGHIITDDLILYRNERVAMAPDAFEETGCFSGGAVEDGGAIKLIYTRHFESGNYQKESVYVATGDDGVNFIKTAHPAFDNSRLPQNISKRDFRDPYPVKIGKNFFVFLGGKDTELNKGVIVVLKGERLEELDYAFTIGPFDELGDMGECPSYCKVDGKDVLVASGCGVKERGNSFKNVNSSVFIVGDIDFEGGSMKVDFIEEIDKGDSFYAPQFVNGAPEPTMIGWFECWGKTYPTQEGGHGWVGALTIPRVISIENGKIYQRPAKALEKYAKPADISAGYLPDRADVTVELEKGGVFTVCGEDGHVTVGSDETGVYLDTGAANNLNGCIRRTDVPYEKCTVRILLDVSGIEVFVADGRYTISSRIYINGRLKYKINSKARALSVRHIGV